MKNIHVLPTDKPSRLYKSKLKNEIYLHSTDIPKDFYMKSAIGQNIYITSDEEIKYGDWVIQVNFEKTITQLIRCVTDTQVAVANDKNGSFTKSKIILTTDLDLIKDGVQAIDDEFLEWFVKNPGCESVEVKPFCEKLTCQNEDCNVCCQELKYKIIIPKQESKQETLEEVAKEYMKGWGGITNSENSFIEGAKSDAAREYWFKKFQEQDKKMYSEEDMKEAFKNGAFKWRMHSGGKCFDEWFEQFKNK